MQTIFIITEANEHIATGHLMECIVCAEELLQNNYMVSFWINDNANDSLKKRIPCQYQEYCFSIEQDDRYFFDQAMELRPAVILFNLREINDKFLIKVRQNIFKYTKLVCIDEFGHRELSADVIINPMIDSYYWDYGESKAALFCGEQYLILSKELEFYHFKEKTINETINKIVITMGGVDPRNYTESLVEIVPKYFPEAEINLILGGGNLRRDEVIKKASLNDRITIGENVTNLLQMIYEADLIFCAGGNTLHESACIGTPAIVLPSMPHEERTADCFGKKGFGSIVHMCLDWKEEILSLLDRINDWQLRIDMSINGKSISDGLGRKRIVKLINSMR